MSPLGLVSGITEWLQRGRHRIITAAGLALAAVAGITLAIYFAAFAGSGPPATVFQTPAPFACDEAPAIDSLAASGSDDWSKVAAPAAQSCFSVTASSGDSAGLALDGSFVLESSKSLDAEELAARVTMTPHVDFDLQAIATDQTSVRPVKADSYRYRIQPRAPLADDTVYRVAVMDASRNRPVREWAFQTRRTLRVVSTLPNDQATDVPLNIGIELTFSHDGVEGVADSFHIAPAVKGRFETHKRTVVFVPTSLQPLTLYTVTLGDNVTVRDTALTLTGGFRYSFETGSEDRTGQTPGGPQGLQFSRRVWESGTQEAPVLAIFRLANGGSTNAGGLTLPFTIFRFDNRDAYLASLDQFTAIPSWARVTRSRYAADTNGLETFSSFDAESASLGQYGDGYVRFPEPLPGGYYLVQTTFEEKTVQALLQVTDVATYVSVSGTRTLLWANDLANKTPLEGAAITAAGSDIAATTGADGAALFDTPSDLIQLESSPFGYTTRQTVGNLIVTAADGRESVVPLGDIFNGYQLFGFREYTFAGSPALYWRYLYTDRHLFHPTDDVHFWGVVRQRDNPPLSQDVVVELSSSVYDEIGNYTPVVIASKTVATTESGTFIGDLPFAAVPGYYQLVARIGDQVVASSYIEVRDFVKPAYKIDVLPSANAVFADETVNFTIRAQFFDGSPVPNLMLNYSSNKGTNTVTTNEAGEAQVSIVPGTDVYAYGPYGSLSLHVTPVHAEEGEITGDAWVQVFGAPLAIDASGDYDNGSATISGTVYNIDLTTFNDNSAKGFEDFRGAPVSGGSVTASVTEQGYTQTETGEVYDFIAKIVRKQYRYDPVSTPIGTFSATTDGAGKFSLSFPAAKDRSYKVDLQASNRAGLSGTQTTWVYSGYSTFKSDNAATLVAQNSGPFVPGDSVSLTMAAGPDDLPAGGDNRYLFYLGQNGIRSYSVEGGPHYEFTFAEEYAPNVTAIGVRFTGATYQEVSYGYSAVFDQKLRELTIAVKPDKATYRPGETVALDVIVTDAKGTPMQAEVLLSAVDEAAFRAAGSEFFYDLNVLESLYAQVPSGVLHSYASHQYPVSINQAERGGGDGARQDFKEVALFDSVTTDAQGHGGIAFDLPDNLTSWRVTAIGVTQDLHAGTSVAFVPVSLPLFADVTMNTSYLTTDQPSVKLRAFGDALGSGDEVSFEVTAPTLFDGTLTASGPAFTPVDLALPALREGRHKLTFRTTSGGLEDAIVRVINVLPSRLLRNEASFYEVKAGETLDARGSPNGITTLSVTDHNRGRYYQILQRLTWTYGDRVDQMLARNLSQELLQQYFRDDSGFPAEFRSLAYQTTDGGVAIFPFADDDLVLSARVAAAAPEQFGRQGLVRYFQAILEDSNETRERGIIALYGMAALGQPVLLDVQALAGQNDLNVRERLYLGLAAAALGDQDTAERLYSGLIAEFGETRGPVLRLRIGDDQDDTLEATSLGAILGAALSDDYAPLLFQYTTENYTIDILVALEQISYLKQALPRLSADPVSFSYSIDGERKEAQLDRGDSLGLRLTEEQLDALDLEVIEGNAGATASYLAPFDPASVTIDPEITVSRTYDGQTGDVTLQEGDLVRIRLSFDLGALSDNSCYQISDLLPSGLKPVTRLYQWNAYYDPTIAYPYNVEGQRVSFCVYPNSQYHTLSYFARVIGTGTYTAEPPVIQSQKTAESINLGQPMSVQIQ